MNSIFENIEVSCFRNYGTPENPKPVNLLSWLNSDKYSKEAERIRTISDKKQRDELKALLPAITPSGLFTYRAAQNLVKHSGFIQFDIDYAGNEHIGNFAEFKKQICNIKNVAYCGLSISGKGYWGLIPIAYPDKHERHFKALQKAFKILGIKIDSSCSDVCRLRGYSFDADAYFNHAAKVFFDYENEKKIQPVKYFTPRNYTGAGAVPENAFQWCMEQKNKSHLFSKGVRHDYMVHLARYCNLKGLQEDETLTGCLQLIQQDFPETEIKSIVKSIYKKQADSHAKIPFTNKKNDYRAFQPEQPEHQQQTFEQPQPKEITEVQEIHTVEENYFTEETPKPESWEQDITELEHYFETATLPTVPVKLSPGSTITNVTLFIRSQLATVKANNGKRTFLPYLNRLQELKQVLTTN